MNLNKNENIVLIDIDGTLIFPATKEDHELCLNYYGHSKYIKIHHEHIQLIKSYKKRGFFIRVHSNNGYRWAREVITELQILDFVDSIETKPCKFVDDDILGSNAVIGQAVFIPMKGMTND